MEFDGLLKALYGLGTGGILAAFFAILWKRADDRIVAMQDAWMRHLEASTNSRIELATTLARHHDCGMM